MSDIDTIITGTLLSLLVAAWCWYMGDDEIERQAHERCLRDIKRKMRTSNSTEEQTGSRCTSADQSGCGDCHAHASDGRSESA